MDRRTKKTRAAIFAALEELLTERKYEQITVQNIIDRANIGRSTFYAHFETKDMLLQAMCQELFEHIFAEHPAAEGSHDFSAGSHTADSRLAHILYHLRDDRERYKRIFSCESADLFWSYFREGFARLADRGDEAITVGGRKIPADFYISYYCGTFIEAVKWWFQNGLSVSPEELTSYFEAVTGARA